MSLLEYAALTDRRVCPSVYTSVSRALMSAWPSLLRGPIPGRTTPTRDSAHHTVSILLICKPLRGLFRSPIVYFSPHALLSRCSSVFLTLLLAKGVDSHITGFISSEEQSVHRVTEFSRFLNSARLQKPRSASSWPEHGLGGTAPGVQPRGPVGAVRARQAPSSFSAPFPQLYKQGS